MVDIHLKPARIINKRTPSDIPAVFPPTKHISLSVDRDIYHYDGIVIILTYTSRHLYEVWGAASPYIQGKTLRR